MVDLIGPSLSFLYFMFIAAITPGPNNVMLTASGINFGYKRTIPHMLGIIVGFNVLIMCGALGVGSIYQAFPQIEWILKGLGSAYLLYLAYRIANAGRVGLKEQKESAKRPMNFFEAAGFQFVNPKAVVFAFAAASFLPKEFTLMESLIVMLVCSTIASVISTNVWALFGKMIAKLFRNDRARQIINVILALLLLATIPMMVL
ncbi:MAG: LysE family translocator [Pseudomonadota bacterium]